MKQRQKNFTLIEVVVALGILGISLAGLLQLLTSSQRQIAKSQQLWCETHMLMQAAEYLLLQPGTDSDRTVPEDFFPYYKDYSLELSFDDLPDEALPESLQNQAGQLPLVGCTIRLIRDADKKTVSSVTVDRFNYESVAGAGE